MLTSLELGSYLQSIRKSQHFSLRKVNELSGISYSYLNMIEHGTRKATPDLLKKLANLYQLNYLDLYQKAGYIDSSYKEGIPYYAKIQDYLQNLSPARTLPVENTNPLTSIFAISMPDDSMLPSIWKNDIIILEASSKFSSGDIVLFSINSNTFLIRKAKKTQNGIVLQPLSEQYEPTFYTREDFFSQKIKILGIVKQLRRVFN